MPTHNPKPNTNITEAHRRAFKLVTNPSLLDKSHRSIALFSCFLAGKPTASICLVEVAADEQLWIVPLFVAVTDDMVLTDHDGEEPQPHKQEGKI
jgi:hypothetical protein